MSLKAGGIFFHKESESSYMYFIFDSLKLTGCLIEVNTNIGCMLGKV